MNDVVVMTSKPVGHSQAHEIYLNDHYAGDVYLSDKLVAEIVRRWNAGNVSQ